jgi:hypothetical protein
MYKKAAKESPEMAMNLKWLDMGEMPRENKSGGE